MTPPNTRTGYATTYTPASDALPDDPRVPRWLVLSGGVAAIVVSVLTIGAVAKRSADATYVRTDSMLVQHQRDSSRLANQHQRDSLILDSRLTRIEDHVARSDSNSTEALKILRTRQP